MGSPRNALTVVYDGHGPHLRLAGPSLVEAVFSGDKDADTVIKERIADLPNARVAVVVTNDKSIRMAVRKKGARVMSCEEFLALRKKKASASTEASGLDARSADAINKELKSIWRAD